MNNIDEGYIKISKRITKHWIWARTDYFCWWIDLILMASWRDEIISYNKRIVELKRGQVIASAKFLAIRWKVSRPTVTKFLGLLQNDNMLVIHTLYGSVTIITICNYDKYQENRTSDFTCDFTCGFTCGFTGGFTQEEEMKEKKKDIFSLRSNIEKEIRPTSEKPKKEILDEVDVEPNFLPVMREWLAYKAERREKYKSPRSLKVCYNNLFKLSGGDPTKARLIVEQSMANNWAGLFELKESSNNGGKTNFGNSKSEYTSVEKMRQDGIQLISDYLTR